ncbi:MAG TPA: serine hydrolase domain-containing protein [Acidobacteriota bacterium]|nr:serine hydrolase domain-containing protein [Acidobacteriota bacterium]
MIRTIIMIGSVCLAMGLSGWSDGQQAAAPFTYPETEIGRRVAGYVRAFNDPNEGALRAFLTDNLAPAALAQLSVKNRLETLRRIKEDTGTLEPVRVRAAGAATITLTARTAKGEWLEMAFAFEPEPPHRLLGVRFGLQDSPPGPDEPETPITEAELVEKLEQLLVDRTSRDEFSGVVLLTRGATPVFQKAYGLASREYNAPNRLDTRFNLGSINKFITQIAIEQLAGKGKLQLDAPIGIYLPDYPNPDAAAKVTVRHLLDMTGGIGDFFGERYAATPKDRIRNLSDYLPLFAAEPLRFEPGARREYSNGGYVVLGLVIEKVSGQSYFDYVREHIYGPAGMSDSGHLETDIPVPNVASGYTRLWGGGEHSGEPRRNNLYTRPCRGSSAGGGYATAGDLLKLVEALKAGRMGAPERSRQITEAGLGIAGGAPGINAMVEVDAGKGYTLVVLSNYDPPVAMEVARQVRSWLARLAPSTPPAE